MSRFDYKARDERGSLVTGTVEGDSRRAAYLQIDAMGLLPIAVSEKREDPYSLDNLLVVFQRVRYDDLIFFTRQLQTVIRAGIPMSSGLKALEEQTSNARLRTAIGEICQDLDKGHSFSEALAKHKSVFSELYVSMVRAGEVSGSLEEILDRLSGLLEFQMKTREMLKAAIRYPLFVVTALVIAFAVIIEFVIPRFAVMFRNSKVQLPLPTRILLLINDLVQAYGVYMLGCAVTLGIFIFFYLRTERGILLLDTLKLKIPLIGPIILKISMSRFATMLDNLVKAGIPLVRTLEVVSRTVGNEFIARKIMEIGGKIERGMGIVRPMQEAHIFPSLVIHLISTGEQTGSLEEMLKEVSTHYDREITYSINRLSTWIEPILTAGLAIMVLFLALAMFLPWWEMMGTMGGGG